MASDWLEDLNPAQREAVEHGDGPLLVVAGAGTGKTKTLACRVARLIDRGAAPARILLLTFTRRAAAEMIGRVRHMLGSAEVAQVWSGTFHATANRLLRLYHRAVNLHPDFTVIDQGDAADLMNLIRGELGLGSRNTRNDEGRATGGRRFPRKQTLVDIYSHTVNAQQPLSETIARRFPWCGEDSEAIGKIFHAYTRRKTENHVLDYDDLLLYWRMLCQAPGIGQKVADRFDHILVDEYQDTNAVQADIVRAMRAAHENIMVVGDDAQSIYSFRAATVRNILDFPKLFPGTHIVKLEQNYRSTQPILAASNAVMDHAKERFTKRLRSDRRSGQRPILYTCQDEAEQCALVCERILDHFEQGVALQRQAVLFRTSHHSAQLEIELGRRNIPFHKYGGLRFIEAAHVKDVLALLRILENPFDQMSWFRVLQLFEGVGLVTARRILDALCRPAPPGDAGDEATPEQSGIASPLVRLLQSPPTVPSSAEDCFLALRKTLAACLGVKLRRAGGGSNGRPPQKTDPPPLAVQIERLHRFYEPLCERHYENPKPRLRDIEQLGQIAARYRSRGRFITDLTLDPPRSTSELAGAPYLNDDFLILSTIHSAKGCEWTSVHIIHAADGMIPSDMALSDEAGVEEERRLLYVAMTRAKDHLYVYFPLRYFYSRARRGDAHGYAQLTRFISDDVRAHFDEGSGTNDREADETVPTHPARAARVQDFLDDLWQS